MFNASPPPLNASPAKARASLLIIDDDPATLRLMGHQLRMLGHVPVCLSEVKEALAVFPTRGWTLVLIDGQLPGIEPFALVGALRALDDELGRHTPLLAMSGDGSGDAREMAMARGADDFFPKPFRRETLREQLVRWSDRQRQADDGPPAPRPFAVPDPPCPGRSTALVDFSTLAALVGSDEATQRRMIESFLRTAEYSRRQIERAWRVGDIEVVCQVAHRLLDSAKALGATSLVSASQAVEEAHTSQGTIAPLVERLVQTLQQVISYLDDHRHGNQ
jgi:CheY-like chemotaxis protein